MGRHCNDHGLDHNGGACRAETRPANGVALVAEPDARLIEALIEPRAGRRSQFARLLQEAPELNQHARADNSLLFPTVSSQSGRCPAPTERSPSVKAGIPVTSDDLLH